MRIKTAQGKNHKNSLISHATGDDFLSPLSFFVKRKWVGPAGRNTPYKKF
jgi:hypothetical protein